MKAFGLIPVKNLSRSKERLSRILSLEERRALVLSMLEDILEETSNSTLHRTVIVGSDGEVQLVAERFDALFLEDPGWTVNDSLNYALKWCSGMGAEAVLIVPSDVPLVSREDLNMIVHLSEEFPVVLSPSKDGGTSALMLKPPSIIKTCFGPGSFVRHLKAASEKGIPVKVYRSRRLSLDIDTIQDLKLLLKSGSGKLCCRFLKQIRMDVRLKRQGSSLSSSNLF